MPTLDLFLEISNAFTQAAAHADVLIHHSDMMVEFDEAPHTPPQSLKTGMSAVYVFMYGSRCLKVGKAGSKSAARFCSHHYGADRAPSTLAKSILKKQASLGVSGLDEGNVEDWIIKNTSRANFLLPSSYGPFPLSLLEAFIQCRLKPEFEGFSSQRLAAVETTTH